MFWHNTHTHTHTQPFNGLRSGTTQVGRYQKKQKRSPTHTHHDDRTSIVNFLHLLRYIASSLFSLSARQSSLTTSLQVLFGLPLGLGPSTSYSMHFFTQSLPSFWHNKRTYTNMSGRTSPRRQWRHCDENPDLTNSSAFFSASKQQQSTWYTLFCSVR